MMEASIRLQEIKNVSHTYVFFYAYIFKHTVCAFLNVYVYEKTCVCDKHSSLECMSERIKNLRYVRTGCATLT